jgi:hypothetical protein
MAKAKLNVNEAGLLEISEFYSGLLLVADPDEVIAICPRDGGFEFDYGGKSYRAIDGDLVCTSHTEVSVSSDNSGDTNIEQCMSDISEQS